MNANAHDSFIVGTRGSRLALRQAELVIEMLRRRAPAAEFAIRPVTTPGDAMADRPVSILGDKGVFVRPIERALLEGELDIAVHSLKDVPCDVETPGLVFAAFASRDDPRDVLVSGSGEPLASLPRGAVVGTGSLRRWVQLLRLRPDLRVQGIRGNVDTRLRKLDEGFCEAVILAAAGLRRLGLEGRITEYLPVDTLVPDAGQGTLVVQTRSDGPARELVEAMDDRESRRVALAERAVVRRLGADCRSPVGAFATIQSGRLHLIAMAAHEDGSGLTRLEMDGPAAEAQAMGERLGERLADALGAYTGP